MRIPGKKSTLAAAIVAISLLGNGVVLADGGRYHDNRQDYGHHGNYGHQKQYQKQRHHKGYRYGGHHDRGYHDKGHYGRHVTNYYEYGDDDDDNENLLIGLAIGGLLGYAINHPDY